MLLKIIITDAFVLLLNTPASKIVRQKNIPQPVIIFGNNNSKGITNLQVKKLIAKHTFDKLRIFTLIGNTFLFLITVYIIVLKIITI